MKNAPSIPGWAVGVAIVAVLAVAAIIGWNVIQGPQSPDPGKLPKEQRQNPYLNSPLADQMENRQGGNRPADPSSQR